MAALPIAAPTPLSMRDVLRVPAMQRLWLAQIVSVFGDFLALFAVITIMTFRLHANVQQVTGIQIAYMGPIAVLGILSGVFVDRWAVKPTLIASDATRAVLCFGLFFVHSVWGFYITLAAISVVSSFFGPAQGVAIRSVVPMHGLRSATALMQQVMFIMRIVGGPVATTLVAAFGPKICYGVDSASFVASALLISSVALATIPKPAAPNLATPDAGTPNTTTQPQATTGIARVFADMQEGASFIFHHAALLFVITALAAGMFAMGCFGPLIAIYVRDVLHASTRTFGLTIPMIGVGLLSGINILNAAAKKVTHTLLVYCGLSGIAVGCFLIATLPHLAAAIPALLLIGFSAGAIIVPSQTMIQEETPHAMLGRVGSTVMSLIFSAQIAGLLLSGLLAPYISVRGVFAFSGGLLAMLLVIGKLWMEPKAHLPAASEPAQ
jgi:DHA3 family macrolide efflux protein-like MFS transporter